ncbi:hypothetical protein EDD18DRAFT_1150514 [Armillaria luteobubalina]|uniref:Uncharacterized protein n=1 Tax=Armillaria luteobubalina TaxID=153913 RepID=A0AA39QDL8_9AGAR|nr:hypothetical protein EDD18DRAFT_1150514 [Armillaria luteobubalina]
MPPIDLKGAFSNTTWISSAASSVTDNPEIFAFSCILFVCTVAYKMSPPLSPRAQLERLNRDIEGIWALFNASGDDADPDRRSYRCATYVRLKQIQIEACVFGICLLQAQKDDVSWSEYLCSSKKVYFDARVLRKEIEGIRIDVKIANMKTEQQRFGDEKLTYLQSYEIPV